jgi:serine/threonine protein kinase
VFLVSDLASKQQFAMKQLHFKAIQCHQDFALAAYDMFTEACVLSKLDHENIIQLHGISETTPKEYVSQSYLKAPENSDKQFFLLTEVLSETLEDRIKRWSREIKALKKTRQNFIQLGRRRRRQLDASAMLERIETTAEGIVRAMDYLHREKIIFQDLKVDNIGFDIETGNVKLFDFGFARKINNTAGPLVGPDNETDICGTPRYMAPEVLQGKGGSKKADVYSFGLVLYELCTLQKPFHPSRRRKERDLSDHTDYVCAGGRPCLELIPDQQVQDLIAACIAQNPEERPSFFEILNNRLPRLGMT